MVAAAVGTAGCFGVLRRWFWRVAALVVVVQTVILALLHVLLVRLQALVVAQRVFPVAETARQQVVEVELQPPEVLQVRLQVSLVAR
jgi:hypothetical protein